MPHLSYVFTTRNKLPYLRETLGVLLHEVRPDEEIVVSNGGSSDGTIEYLEELERAGKITLLRGPDTGEAHGFNKAFLASKGELIKPVTDDDALYFAGVRECKDFMLSHKEIDVLSTDGVKRRNNTTYPYSPMLYQSRFEARQRKGTPFAFCGLGLMIRKSSLPLVGLLNTNFVRVDAEYSLRVTASKAKMAWYTKECFAHIRNENSNSVTKERRITDEMEQLESLYLDRKVPLWRTLARKVKNYWRTPAPTPSSTSSEEWQELFRTSVAWFKENDTHSAGQFLT
ncbi:glycosyltransferase [Candidatus Parcubacteria bacterium]|nr:glycosyltransferase [Candidatus Parcubacteria bacterium]